MASSAASALLQAPNTLRVGDDKVTAKPQYFTTAQKIATLMVGLAVAGLLTVAILTVAGASGTTALAGLASTVTMKGAAAMVAAAFVLTIAEAVSIAVILLRHNKAQAEERTRLYNENKEAKDAKVSKADHNAVVSEKEKLAAKLNDADARVAELTTQIEALKSSGASADELAAAQTAQAEAEGRVAALEKKAGQAAQTLRTAIEQKNREIVRLGNEVDALHEAGKKIETLRGQIEALQAHHQELTTQTTALETTKQSLEAAIKDVADNPQTRDAEAETAHKALIASRQQVRSELVAELAALETQRDELNGEVSKVQRKLEKLQETYREESDEIARLKDRLAVINDEISSAQSKKETIEQELQTARGELSAAQAAAAVVRAETAAAAAATADDDAPTSPTATATPNAGVVAVAPDEVDDADNNDTAANDNVVVQDSSSNVDGSTAPAATTPTPPASDDGSDVDDANDVLSTSIAEHNARAEAEVNAAAAEKRNTLQGLQKEKNNLEAELQKLGNADADAATRAQLTEDLEQIRQEIAKLEAELAPTASTSNDTGGGEGGDTVDDAA